MNSKISRSRSSSGSSSTFGQSGSASLSGKYTFPDNAPVISASERLLNEAAFKRISKSTKTLARRSGSKVDEIDKKLKAYEHLNGSPTNIVKRADLLEELKTLCENYVHSKSPVNGERVAGVQALLHQITTELSFMKPFADAHTSTQANPKNALKDYFLGRDKLAEAQATKHPISDKGGQTPDTNELYGTIVRKLAGDDIRKSTMKEIIDDDLAFLKQMSTQSGVDELLKKIIMEVLRNENSIHFQETGGVASGAVLAGQKDLLAGIKKKYRLDMQMDQTESIIRMSSLLHEMTHIAIHEHFDNTVIHLAFNSGMSQKDVLALSAHRTDQLADLEELLEQEKDLFSSQQYDAILEKITYPVKGKNTLESYANAFKTKGLSTDEYNNIMNLSSKGANNTLTEFDTVINQTFFMVNAWKIDSSSEFYKALKKVAREAYKHRKT